MKRSELDVIVDPALRHLEAAGRVERLNPGALTALYSTVHEPRSCRRDHPDKARRPGQRKAVDFAGGKVVLAKPVRCRGNAYAGGKIDGSPLTQPSRGQRRATNRRRNAAAKRARRANR